jgi:dTDP-4-dehydrorhamnose reductase
LRTSWVYSGHGKNFLLTILRLAKERNALSVVDDQWGAPTWARTIAEATVRILSSNVTQSQPNAYTALNAMTGIYHLTASGTTTWHGFARAIVEDAPLYLREALLLTPEHIAPINTSEYPRPARRPHNSTMSSEKLRRVFGVTLPEWRSDLRRCLACTRQE